MAGTSGWSVDATATPPAWGAPGIDPGHGRGAAGARMARPSGFVDDLPADQRVADASGHFQPEERRVLALAAQGAALDLPPRVGIEDADIGGTAGRQRA